MRLKSVLVDSTAFERTLKRIAHEITEKNEDIEKLCLIGIKTRGIPLAKRISDLIYLTEQKRVETGTLDITFYRDDLTPNDTDAPIVSSPFLPFDVAEKNIVLVDDVIYTGRTARAALDAVMSFGRPSRVQLAEFVDRGHRELPIRADFVGKNIPTSRNEIIRVELKETDGADGVKLYEK